MKNEKAVEATKATADCAVPSTEIELTSLHLMKPHVVCGPNGGSSSVSSRFILGKEGVSRLHFTARGTHVVVTNEHGQCYIHSDEVYAAYNSSLG